MPTATTAEAECTDRPPSCCFVVTGFGPFRGVPDNPTSVLINRLRELRPSNLRATHVLETAAEFVRPKLEEIYGASVDSNGRPDERRTIVENKANAVIVLHLGVNYKGKRFHLERCAYNDATFRVPDERGYQPQNECVLESEDSSASPKFGACFNTSLNVQHLCQEMQACSETIVSDDPGRFVCNFTYCLSLSRCQSANKRNVCARKREQLFHALFLHVPPFDVICESKQLDFILKLMQKIEQHVGKVVNN